MFYVIVGILSTMFTLFALAVIIAAMCIYIIRDTRKYKMDTLPWIIAVILIQFTGLCFYWYARKQHCKTCCPVCSAEIPEGEENCIRCGIELDTVRPQKFSFGRLIITICGFFQAIALILLFFVSL